MKLLEQMKVVRGMLNIDIEQLEAWQADGNVPQYHEPAFTALVGETGKLLAELAEVEIIPKEKP